MMKLVSQDCRCLGWVVFVVCLIYPRSTMSHPKKRQHVIPKSYTVLRQIYEQPSKGQVFLENSYNEALQRSFKQSESICFYLFRVKLWPGFFRHRASSPKLTRCDKHARQIYNQYIELTSKTLCSEHMGLQQNGYPVLSTRYGIKSSVKVQLHQIPHYMGNGWLFGPNDSELVFAHSCHNSLCLIHATPTTRQNNNSQTRCQCFQIVNYKLVNCCFHRPQCIRPGSMAFNDEHDLSESESESDPSSGSLQYPSSSNSSREESSAKSSDVDMSCFENV